MSTYPRLEARVSAQERRQTILDARIEELSEDVTTSVKQLSDDMKASFKQLAEYQVKTEQQLDSRLDTIETTMATKEDITSLKATMATKEELAALGTRIDKVETLLTEQTALLQQILARFPENAQ